MKLNLAILLLPAASAFTYSSGHHFHHKSHHHNKTHASGTAPYGLSNGTAAFGSSGLLTAPTGIAGKAVYSTVVITNDVSYQTIVESAPASLNEAGSSLPFSSSCTQATVTVTTNAVVTVTITASESGASQPVIPTQAPVPIQSGTFPPVESLTVSTTEPSSSTPLPLVTSAITLGAVGAEPSSSTSTPVVADTPKTVAAAPVVVPTSSASPAAKAAATVVTAPKAAGEDTPAAAPAAAPASNSSKSAKRGIIVTGADNRALTAAFANTKVSWLGNWYSGPPVNYSPDMGMEYVPQMYSPTSDSDGSWTSNAGKGVAAGDKYFMSFGEPKAGNIPVETAVTAWMKYIEPYAAQGVSLGAPGNLQNPGDMEWTANFLEQCETAGCTIGFLCVHWFWTPGPNGQQDFKNAVNNITTQAKGKPVWVDNFGANGDAEGQIEFLTAIIPWLEDNDLIARYGYVALNRTQGGFLPETGDELSDLGKFYATF